MMEFDAKINFQKTRKRQRIPFLSRFLFQLMKDLLGDPAPGQPPEGKEEASGSPLITAQAQAEQEL